MDRRNPRWAGPLHIQSRSKRTESTALSDLDWTVFDAAARLLRTQPDRAAEWWRGIEARALREGDFKWLFAVTSALPRTSPLIVSLPMSRSAPIAPLARSDALSPRTMPLNTEPVIVTWAIMAFLTLLAIAVTRRLSLMPSKAQTILELFVGAIDSQIRDTMQVDPGPYRALIGTIFVSSPRQNSARNSSPCGGICRASCGDSIM